MKPITVIFGANGFLGRYLSRHLARQGKEVVCVGRNREGWSGDGMFLEWDGKTIGPWALALEGADTVINLAGRSVNCRYDEKNRREILDSRIDSTRVIGKAVAECQVAPKVWMNASTATWYRHAEDKPQDEWTGEPGEGLSFAVARTWEEEFFAAPVPPVTRKVALRIGMVLANEPDTVFDVMSHLASYGLGGAMAGGRQRVSWIHIEDFLRVADSIASDAFISGVVNVVATECPTNRELMQRFRETVGMPIGLPAAKWMLELGAVAMKTETELITKSRWVSPVRLKDLGFRWRYRNVEETLGDLKSRRGLNEFFRPAASRAT